MLTTAVITRTGRCAVGCTQSPSHPCTRAPTSILSLFVNTVTTFNFLIARPFSETKTLLSECCIVMLFIDNSILALDVHWVTVCCLLFYYNLNEMKKKRLIVGWLTRAMVRFHKRAWNVTTALSAGNSSTMAHVTVAHCKSSPSQSYHTQH